VGKSPAPARAGVVLGTLILAAGIANVNLAVANVALPDIGQAFKASQTAIDLIAVGYSLGLAASVLYLGAIGDRYGRKLLLVLGMALSVPACLLAAFAPSARLVHARGSRHRPQDFPVQGSREAPARRAAWRAAVSMTQIVSVARRSNDPYALRRVTTVVLGPASPPRSRLSSW
jgi:MFS family permease